MMAHWARIDETSTVVAVTVGDNADPDEGLGWLEANVGGTWIKTSYNTRGGIYYDPTTGQPAEDQSKALRFNYAGIGFHFDADHGLDGAFIPPKPYPSWVLNPATALWDAPEPMPLDGNTYTWDEETLSWVEVTP